MKRFEARNLMSGFNESISVISEHRQSQEKGKNAPNNHRIDHTRILRTKLILVDGLPGSGKSTTAQFIALQLERNSIPARWFYELDNSHPIHAFHVWSREGPEKFIETTTENWRSFVAKGKHSENVNILESTLFQSTVRLLLQSDISRQRIIEYTVHIEEMISELQPVLIYFSSLNVAQALRTICEKRKKTWEQYFIQVIDGSLYAKHRELQNFEGVVTFFQEYQELTTDLFSRFEMNKLALDNSKGHWDERHRQICEFLGLPFIQGEEVPQHYLAQFPGRYRDEKSRLEITISLEGNALSVHDLLWSTSRLIPKENNRFYVEACTIELYFQPDALGSIRKMKIGGSFGWKFYGRMLSRIE